ncbi:hypothetical protein ACFQX6_07440 [Streptosporangium lutulentum]
MTITQPYPAHLSAASAAHSWFEAALAALDGIDDTAYGVVLIGPMGKVRVVNRAARLLLATYFRISAREGDVLPDELNAWLAEQLRVLSGLSRRSLTRRRTGPAVSPCGCSGITAARPC